MNINEANDQAYQITKFTSIVTVDKNIGQKIIYKFKTKYKMAGYVFRIESASKVFVDFGVLDKDNKITEKLVVDKSELLIVLNTRRNIINRFIKEYNFTYLVL